MPGSLLRCLVASALLFAVAASCLGAGITDDLPNPAYEPSTWKAAQRFDAAYDDAADLWTPSYEAAVVESWQRYNTIRQKSAHNAYQRDEAILDQLVYHRVRSLEFDIHNGKSGWGAVSQNWYVYHANLVDTDTTCHRLSDCLNELRAFHLANPYHEVVTVWIDLKDDFESGRNPADLDARIQAHIPSSWIFKPSNLVAGCPGATTLRAALDGSCDWPYLSSLRGKFIFALTGGDVSSSGTKLNTYVAGGAAATSRVGFIAPNLTSSAQIGAHDYVVFFNMSNGDKHLADDVTGAGFIGRVWGLNGSGDYASARALFAHHLGTDMINYHQDPWTITHNGDGWPFECFSSCVTGEENVRVLGVDVNSEDIWGGSDHFRFLYEINTSTADAWWTTSVATPNSHVEEWAKGCLMARATTAANSPYFAVCRPADEHKLRIQWRTSAGGSTSSSEVDIVGGDTIDQESLTFIRLLVYNNGTCGAGYGSQDGQIWTLIGYKCFSTTLPRQGLATSSHGNSTVRFLYTNVAKNGAPYTNYTFPYVLSAGTVRGYWIFDGVMP